MKKLFMMCIPLMTLTYASGLGAFINHAQKLNGQIKAKEITVKSKAEEVESAKSAYWPTLDVGGSYSVLNPSSIVQPGRTATVYASVHLELYDGGRKAAVLKAKSYAKEASFFEK